MSNEREPIGVIGTGYVGLVTAAGFADLGSDVWCIDIDADKIARLNNGEVPIYEPGLAECLERNRERLHFSTDLAEALEHARLLFVAVGTPPTYSGDADLSAVHAVVAAMPASDRHALIMKSTVPVGTGAAIRRVFGEQGKDGFRYVSCPEFLKEGSALDDFLSPDRVVIGDQGDWAGEAVTDLYRPLLNAEHGGEGRGELVRTDIESAEMVKLAANAFLATKISFINEIANVCEETGADVTEVARGMGLDDRIGPKFLQAGIGFGGSCFPKDVNALKQLAGNSGYHFQLLNAVIEVNELQKRRVIGKLEKHLGSLVGKRVALLGLAFKPNTDDMREASSLVLAARLQAAGSHVVAYDPIAEQEARHLMKGVEFADGALEALEGADAAVLVTEWDEFRALAPADIAEAMAGTLVIDGRNALDPVAVRDAGLTYEGIGAVRTRVKAVILVGGEGTRLRPLTSTVPKPVVTLVDRPFMAYMLEWLAGHGVEDVVMACGFLPTKLRDALGDGGRYGVRLTFVEEPEPRGTGGALRFADESLPGGLGERFLMLNGDVLTDIDLSAQIAQHAAGGARATLGLVPVEDPSAYGLVRLGEDGAVRGFLEKPKPEEIDTNLISAGAYVLERSVLDLIAPSRNVSIEREVWPKLVGDGLHGTAHEDAYWLDIGTPERYLQGSCDILAGSVRTAAHDRLDEHGIARGEGCTIEGHLRGPVALGAGCVIAEGAVVGPHAVLGARVHVDAGATVERAVVLDDSCVGRGSIVREAILAPSVDVGADCTITGYAVLGAGVRVGAGNHLDRGVRVFPSVQIPDGGLAF